SARTFDVDRDHAGEPARGPCGLGRQAAAAGGAWPFPPVALSGGEPGRDHRAGGGRDAGTQRRTDPAVTSRRVRAIQRRLIAVALVVGAAFTASSALADAQSEAEALIVKGVDLREKGRDEEALAVFRQALARSPSSRARAQVGLAEQALGMWTLAETDLAAALATEGDPWIAKNRGALDGALAVIRKHIATLEVRGADKAEVYLDGVRLGTAPGPFRVEAGKRTLEVRASGFQSTTRAVELPAGGIARETVTLVSTPAPADDARSPRTEAVQESGSSRATSADPGANQRLLGWAFVGTGAALLATGAVGLIVRKGIIDDYNATCPGLGVDQPKSCDDQVSSSRTWLTVSILTLVGGGVVTTGGIVLVAAAPSADSAKAKSTAAAPRLACAPSGLAIACAGTF
ncbi:MAG: hypothetical protein K0S65_6576, partial [Labilithrix sp.]|nr:hypothetical protein [Labilithrix sp.]